MSYWIDGYFVEWWTGKSYYSHNRSVFVPKFAVVRLEPDRIYITKTFAESRIKLAAKKFLDWSDKKDANLGLFVKALNTPWEKEPYVEPEPRFRVSLP